MILLTPPPSSFGGGDKVENGNDCVSTNSDIGDGYGRTTTVEESGNEYHGYDLRHRCTL